MPGLPLLLIGLLWASLIYNLAAQWTAFEQYRYGWAVPVLCLYLLFQRWQNRPTPACLQTAKPVLGLIIACAVLLFPVRLLHEANPTWRLTSLIWTGQIILLTLGFIYLTGGRTWLRHFAFPICFFFVAVPWPTGLESLVIQSLTRLNVGSTVELLGVFGFPALQHGNVLEVGTGMVGVDEACSGIRSFQATLMLALFFGELFALTIPHRLICLLAGVFFSFVLNVARTTLLTIVASRHGIPAVDKWHDPAGITILVGCFACLWLLARGLRGSSNLASTRQADVEKAIAKLNPIRMGYSVALLAWLMTVEGATEFWYRSHEQAQSAPKPWTINTDVPGTAFTAIEIPHRVKKLLAYDEGMHVHWADSSGNTWQMFYFRWLPTRNLNRRVALNLAKAHSPEICLPSTGMSLKCSHGVLESLINQEALAIQHFEFDAEGRRLHVFYGMYEDVLGPGRLALRRPDWQTRVGAALAGSRNYGQRFLELAVYGPTGAEEARTAFARQIEKLFKTEQTALPTFATRQLSCASIAEQPRSLRGAN